ncbi:replication initiation protein [Hydromonas duriensis]|uniref:Replication initiator protein n=1 Tax=Hydromonas duriensis TaxID=1527608 RepID=A0A4R6Y6Y6_9BURK|nr:replication initiation protein [Hydromonas duriensis]TDR30237.1 replication initiator protein [Hydromonas duriensis]
MASIIPKKRQSPIIKTPQALIHIRHKISILQYKYWILFVRELREQFENVRPADQDGFRYISMEKISDALGYVPKKSEIDKDLRALKNEDITCNLLEKDGQTVLYGAGFISEWKVSNQKISFKLPSLIENVVRGLHEPNAIFQLLNWSVFNHFTGKYEAIIYKLCKDYVGVKQTPYMTIQEFRNYMGLKDEEYKEFKDFNRVLITNPCKKINQSEISDIEVEVEYERVGRSAIGLKFHVANKHRVSLPVPELESSKAFRFAKVTIESATQKEYLAMRSSEEIELCIERANEYGVTKEKKGVKIREYGALYRKAITEGWHTSQLQKKQIEAAENLKSERSASEQAEITIRNKLYEEKQVIEREQLFMIFDNLPEYEKEKLRDMYSKSLSELTRPYFKNQGERSAMHKVNFINFVKPFIETFK